MGAAVVATARPPGWSPGPPGWPPPGLPPPRRPSRAPLVVALAVVAVLLVANGVVAGLLLTSNADETAAPGTSGAGAGSADPPNAALVDEQRTREVADQVSQALVTVFSYDFTRLDANERAARAVITGPFVADYDQIFAQVRDLAPAQQAVLQASVAAVAVTQLRGDRAEVLAFLDQQGSKGATGEEVGAAGRLRVKAQRVDGRWKLAGVENL